MYSYMACYQESHMWYRNMHHITDVSVHKSTGPTNVNNTQSVNGCWLVLPTSIGRPFVMHIGSPGVICYNVVKYMPLN